MSDPYELEVPEDPAVTPGEVDPFDPPPGYEFEEELRGEPPRSRPAELSRGRHATQQRKSVSGVLLAGALCVVADMVPVVREWGLYFLPLQYLTWIGLFLGAVGVIAFVAYRLNRGPYRYVEEGRPIVARVRALLIRPTALVNSQPTTYRFFALLEYLDPDSGGPRMAEVSSNDISAARKDRLTTTYRVGDYVTAVYLPGDPAKTLRLYGFLDLRPGLGVVERDRAAESGPLKTIAVVGGAALFFGILFWNVYAYAKFQPLAVDFARMVPPFAAGAVVLGGALLWSIAAGPRRARDRLVARNREAAGRGEPLEQGVHAGWFGDHGALMGLVLVFGALLLGGATAISWCYSANALLDASPPKYRPIQVDGMIAVTHKALFREYKVQYHFLDGDPKSRDFLSTPPEMIRLVGDPAVAEVHAGRFGWPWVKAIIPAADLP